jgi:hypothetical protein
MSTAFFCFPEKISFQTLDLYTARTVYPTREKWYRALPAVQDAGEQRYCEDELQKKSILEKPEK